MKKKNATLLLMIEQFQRIINKFNIMEQKPFSFGDSVSLNPAEIHTIEAIGQHNGANITELARVLGITKGGVSQMINKLDAKGLVAKTRDGQNEKEIKLRLTPAGMKAFRGHEAMHAAMYNELLTSLNQTNPEVIGHVLEILNKIEFYLDQYARE